jgi:hypothetical protein
MILEHQFRNSQRHVVSFSLKDPFRNCQSPGIPRHGSPTLCGRERTLLMEVARLSAAAERAAEEVDVYVRCGEIWKRLLCKHPVLSHIALLPPSTEHSVLISFWFLGFWIEKLLDSWCDAVTWYCLWFRDGLNWSQFTCLLVDSRPLGMKTHVDCGLLKWFPTLVLSLQHDSENGTNWTAYSL